MRPGWELLTVNGVAIPDVLAFRRELAAGRATLEVRPEPGAASAFFEVDWEEPGLEFEDVIFDGIRLCANHCDFCYIHQMPKGMRKSLYIMDDDFRTSFLYGSFVTLTNLSEDDIARILDEHLSPLYVSVHTVDEDLRGDLMKWWPNKVAYRGATRIRDMVERLEGIELYTQLVLVPGRNDGDRLDQTVEYLAAQPHVQSLAVVPVGLTDHRSRLAEVPTFDSATARDVLERVGRHQRRLLAERGSRFVFASDEFYLTAADPDTPLPDEAAYEGYPMLENGVGMVRDFLSAELPAPPASLATPLKVIAATGKLFAPVLREALAPLAGVGDLEIEVRELTNRTFGAVTTVAGLLAGRDVLAGVEPGEADVLLLSPNMFKYGTETMLDDRTRSDLERELRMRVEIGGKDIGELYRTILSGSSGNHLPSFGFSTHAIKESAKQH